MHEVSNEGRKTDQGYWNQQRQRKIQLRFPQSLLVGTRNIRNVLKAFVRPGMSFLEVGFAPGIHLAWVGKALGAKIAGVDFSENGVEGARGYFAQLGLEADLRCEDFFSSSFAPNTFDVVYSAGFIEHFDDPAPVVAAHVKLARPGGKIIILVPNYGGIYGQLQQYYCPENLLLHNTAIMNCGALKALAPATRVSDVRAYGTGKLCSDLLGLSHKHSFFVSKVIELSLNTAGLLQPMTIDRVCPLLVLEMTKE